MKPKLLQVATSPDHSFSVRQDRYANINNRWHYHAEVELIKIHKGSGTQFIGDDIKRFEPGNIVLVGSNLPHYWKFDETQFQSKKESNVFSTVIHFFENFWGDKFINLPETKSIKSVLEKAKRGISVSGKDAQYIGSLIDKINATDGLMRLMTLVECLSAFANASEITLLSSIGFNVDFSDSENERINAIYNYSLSRFSGEIYLEEIAAVAGMVPNSFCRYFKSRTGKTYSQFLTELRIGQACKLLIENKLSIKQLCYESGFNNFTCFHKNFKAITGKSPQKYQQEYLHS
ncbi:MAG TPA: AraC family transcriptional regulator [Cyclobacteriaceae bacterium]|jgi:AraC-like DNA-binding protein|nr:AraC family transcriptional regulator [Cyclobacteriaceae bacterium]